MVTAAWIQGDLCLGHRFAGGPEKSLKLLVFHPLSTPREAPNEHSLPSATHWPAGGSAAVLPVSSCPSPGKGFLKLPCLG